MWTPWHPLSHKWLSAGGPFSPKNKQGDPPPAYLQKELPQSKPKHATIFNGWFGISFSNIFMSFIILGLKCVMKSKLWDNQKKRSFMLEKKLRNFPKLFNLCLYLYDLLCWVFKKGKGKQLDGVGPVDNRPSTTSFKTIFKQNKHDMLHMTRDTWHMTCDRSTFSLLSAP